MNDRRQAILDRLTALLGGLSLGPVVRNRGELSSDKRPFVALHDGSERSILALPRGVSGAVSNTLMEMAPAISYLPVSQKPKNETVSEVVNEVRAKIVYAVLTDTTLKQLVGSNGQFHLTSVDTDLAIGSRMEGELTLTFTFVYPLLVSELN